MGAAEDGGVLGGDDHLVADAALPHPLADPDLGLLVLVVVGRVDEVAALAVEVVEDALGRRLVARPHVVRPLGPEVHRAQAERAHADRGRRRQQPVALQGALWGSGALERHGDEKVSR